MNRQFREQVELKTLKLDHVASGVSGVDYDEEEKKDVLTQKNGTSEGGGRDRKVSQVTSAVYSDCDDEKAEKLGVISQDTTQVTDAGIIETTQYFEKKSKEAVHRKRSLSWSKSKENDSSSSNNKKRA